MNLSLIKSALLTRLAMLSLPVPQLHFLFILSHPIWYAKLYTLPGVYIRWALYSQFPVWSIFSAQPSLLPPSTGLLLKKVTDDTVSQDPSEQTTTKATNQLCYPLESFAKLPNGTLCIYSSMPQRQYPILYLFYRQKFSQVMFYFGLT